EIREDGLGVAIFDLPGEKVNKLSRDVFAELSELLVRLQREPRLRGLLLRSGKPDVFIAGADIKEFTQVGENEINKLAERGQAIFEQLAKQPVILVAAHDSGPPG